MKFSDYVFLLVAIYSARLFGPFGSTVLTLFWLLLFAVSLWNGQ